MSLNNLPIAVEKSLKNACIKYGESIVQTLSLRYNFDAEEASRYLYNSEDTPKKESKKELKTANKPKVLLPYCEKVNEETCFGVKKNHQLFTQCTNSKESGKDLCKTCGKKDLPFGTIQERSVVSKEEFETAYKVKIANYGNVMQKLKIEKEDALKEAERLGLTIPEDQFEVTKPNRGRPKKSVIVSDSDEEEKPKKSRGRPKKEKKLVSSLNPGDDLIASLVKEVKEEEESSASSSEDELKLPTPPGSPKKKRAPKKSKEEKEAEKKEKAEKKEQKKEKAEKKEQEKKEKAEKKEQEKKEKAEKKEQEKKEKAEKKEQEKADAKAKKEQEKAEKKEAEKKEKVEKKVELKVEIPAVKESPKDEFKPESADELSSEGNPMPSPELTWEEPEKEDDQASESDDEEVDVVRMEWKGVEYLKDDSGVIYDPESQDAIGHWDDEDERVVLYNES